MELCRSTLCVIQWCLIVSSPVSKLLNRSFGEDLLILSGNGVASIFVFKNKAAGHLKIMSNDNDDDVDIALRRKAKTIVAESITNKA